MRRKGDQPATNHFLPLLGTEFRQVWTRGAVALDRVVFETATAELANGMLHIRLPKIEDRRGEEVLVAVKEDGD